jgi:outer membrane lipoprotein SlyB
MFTFFIKKYRITLIGVLVGAILGWLYWANIGCSTGTCIITSNPVNSSLYGALLGALISDSFRKKENVKTNTTIQTHDHH